ncbi:hypothetical protein NQD34_005859 [Periophthalmus magnuspinnatus]|nr:hypothetical protein NQD34_005859 [Periophthalmus magnuspinnatus]
MAPVALLVALALLPRILCAQVPPPEKLTARALNTNYTLLWTWSGSNGQTASFTVQYTGTYRKARKDPKWKPACEKTSNMYCDLNPLNLHYLGIYTLRVCATVNGLNSEWVSLDFAPAKDAAVGPPTIVSVSPAGSDLEVSISEPQTNNNTSMKEKISSLYYRYTYWEDHIGSKIPQVLDSPNTRVVMENLLSWTKYCVCVQSCTIEPNRTSTFTEPVCTSTNGGLSWAQISLIFFTCLCIVFLLVFGIVFGCFHCHRLFKNSFNPKVTLPSFLNDFGISPSLLGPDRHSELHCDLLSVNSPSPQQVLFSGRHSLQSSSEDSGIYTSTSDKSTSAQNSAPCSESQMTWRALWV